MDEETNSAVQTIAKAHDLLAIEVLGVMALIGALIEVVPIDPERVAVWCDLVTRGQAGISQVTVQNAADAILNYARANGPSRQV